MDIAVLDLGSTSFHLLIARLSAGGQVQPLDRQRATLHLGSAVARHGFLPPDIAGLAVRTAVRLWRHADCSGVDQAVGVATSALRDAANGDAVISRIVAATGLDVRVLSGVEEARLAYQGASARLPAARGHAWCSTSGAVAWTSRAGTTTPSQSGRPACPWE